MLTKKDYEAIAKIIKKNSCWNEEYYQEEIAKSLAGYFEDNPRFDRKKFLDACGL